MLTIRQEQMAVLAHEPQKKFRCRVATYLRKNLPEETNKMSDEQLNDKIIMWQKRAATYDVKTERGIAKWCFMAMRAGDEFDNKPEIHTYLKAASPPPATKMDSLMAILKVYIKKSESRS